jgi:hypothetical protein
MSDAHRDLVGLSRQVLYDFEMLEALVKRQVDLMLGSSQAAWRERFPWTGPVHRQWFEENAFIEAGVMHARALADFLYESPPTPERTAARAKRRKASKAADCFAEQWFDNPMTWRIARGRRAAALTDEALNHRVAREVAHLTKHRAGFTDAGPPWNPFEVYSALADVMERFAQEVDPAKVCGDFHARVEAAIGPPLRQPAPDRPRGSRADYTISTPTQARPFGEPQG